MKSKLIASLSFVIVLLTVGVQISLAANEPVIVSWGNNVTNNDNLNFNAERLQTVAFNVTANQTIADWHWGNATIKSGNGTANSNATRQFTTTGTFYVSVYGNNTNGTTDTKTWTVTVVDTNPPLQVTGLTNDTPTQVTVNLSWTAGSEDDLWGYEVFKNDSHLAYTQNNFYNVTGLTASTLYHFKVRANDTSSNWSFNSSTVSITTMAVPPVPTYSISGYVLNASNGIPITGAVVSNSTLGLNTTDSSGYYILSGAANGTWRITATATGYTGNYSDAPVNGASLTNVNISLTPAAPAPPHPGALKIVWFSPGAVDYIFVNETMTETITYMVTTNQPTTNDSWYLDYSPVSTSGQAYTRTWDILSVGNHVIKYTGKNANGTASFEWYINVYNETATPPVKRGILQIIDDALANHAYDIKIRMFNHKCDVAPNASERAKFIKERNQLLQDEIAKRQMTREALRKEFKAGNITEKTYVAALHTVQSEFKNAVKGKDDLKKIEKKFESEKDDHDLKKIEKNNNGKNNNGKNNDSKRLKNGHSSDDREEDEGDD